MERDQEKVVATYWVIQARRLDLMSKALPASQSVTRRPCRMGSMFKQRKIDEAKRLTPAQRLLRALELLDAAAVLNRACSKKR